GDYYQFYGTPIGFTFVGLASPDPNDSDPNIARVTYVVYHDVDDEIVGDIDSNDRATYRLLRYVEPNAETLDDFPVQWDSPQLAGLDSGGLTVQDLIDAEIAARCSGCDEEQAEFIARIKKRELWIHMLAGGNDREVPNAWNIGPPLINIGADVNDYVISDNILNVFTNKLDPDGPGGPLPLVETTYVMHRDIRPVIQDASIDDGGFVYPGIIQTDTDGIFATDWTLRTFFFTYADIMVSTDPDTGFQQTRAIPSRFWSDLRNVGTEIGNNGLDDDNDGFFDEPAVGNPFTPRLPQNVTSHFTLFFPSPYAGAPDFERAFDQNIDIPSGYRRLPAE
ncbi:MAG: hypothetical protein AAB353_14770, partial [Candidatus Hydrogenedentota bacterium]